VASNWPTSAGAGRLLRAIAHREGRRCAALRDSLTATRPVRLLQTSKVIRAAQQPCAALYETWSLSGCPERPSRAELECLNGIGGPDGPFCQGTYAVDADGQHSTGVSATSVARRVARLIQSPPPGTLVVKFGMGPVVLKIQTEAQSRPMIIVTEDSWRRKGRTCSVSVAQAVTILTEILTRTGSVTLPCSSSTSAPRSVRVTRRLNLTARRIDLATETVLLSAVRT